MAEKHDHKKTDPTISPGYCRKEIYAYIESMLGRGIDEEDHKELRKLLKNMANAKTKSLQARISKISIRVEKLEKALRRK